MKTLALFDFDGTVTRRDTLLPFLLFSAGLPKCILNLIRLFPTLALYALGKISNSVAKEKVLSTFFKGEKDPNLRTFGQRFAKEKLFELLRPEAIQRLEWHQSQGHQCILVSASILSYLEACGKQLGFDTVLCTQLESDQTGTLTGRFQGTNCYGSEKVHRLIELLGSLEKYSIYAYGDSRGDLEMLNIAHHSYYRSFTLLRKDSQ